MSVCISEQHTQKCILKAEHPPLRTSPIPSQGEEDQCPASVTSSNGIQPFTAICSAFTVWYTAQTSSLQVCKCVFCFIWFRSLPGCCFWQLLSHTEEHLIDSSGFNAVLYKVTQPLRVTLKMFGPWAIDHSQEKYFSFMDDVYGCISRPANWTLHGGSTVTHHCRNKS